MPDSAIGDWIEESAEKLKQIEATSPSPPKTKPLEPYQGTAEKQGGSPKGPKEKAKELQVHRPAPGKERDVPVASFDVDLEKINSKFRQHDRFLQLLDAQLNEKPQPELKPKAPRESAKSRPGSDNTTPVFSPKSSSTHNARSLRS